MSGADAGRGRTLEARIKEVIRGLDPETEGNGVYVDEVVSEAVAGTGYSKRDALEALSGLHKRGEIYQPRTWYVRLTDE